MMIGIDGRPITWEPPKPTFKNVGPVAVEEGISRVGNCLGCMGAFPSGLFNYKEYSLTIRPTDTFAEVLNYFSEAGLPYPLVNGIENHLHEEFHFSTLENTVGKLFTLEQRYETCRHTPYEYRISPEELRM